MIVLTALIKIVDGRCEDFEREFYKLASKVRKDPGTIIYVLHRDTKNPNQYFVYEKYENDAARQYHGSTPHFKEFFKNTGPMLFGPVEINVYQEIV
jgi:quinol monooxygenase YgiN